MKVDTKPWSLYPLETRGLNSKKGNGPGSLFVPFVGVDFVNVRNKRERVFTCLLIS